VTANFWLRGIRGGNPLSNASRRRFLGFAVVVQTTASIAAVGGSRLRLGISFEAERRHGGCWLVTETRVAASVPRALLAFRAY
jgi:hypothetical protein